MSIREFTTKYKGKKVDYDGYPYNNKFQCYDLFVYYNRDVLKANVAPVLRWTGGARDLYEHYDDLPSIKKHYIRVKRRVGRLAQRGDMVIWGGMPWNEFGHVDIALKRLPGYGFVGFDQNWPIGSPAHNQKHSYRYVLGYLRPRKDIR